MQRQTFCKLFNSVKALKDTSRCGYSFDRYQNIRYLVTAHVLASPRGTRYGGRGTDNVDIHSKSEYDKSEGDLNDLEEVALRSPQKVPRRPSLANEAKIEELLEGSLTGDSEAVKPEFPSDVKLVKEFQRYSEWKRDQTRHAFKPKVDPEDTSIIFFPGQGSQFVGMAKKLLQFPNVPEMFEIASATLGYDLLKVCLNGPKSELDKTIYCQPAIFVTSLAAIEALREESPKAIENCIGCAGFSVGEYAALVFSGSMIFEDGVRVVKARARAMQQASEEVSSGMMTVFLGPNNKCNFACHTARTYCMKKLEMDNPVCQTANFLYPECKVLAGNVEALEFIEKHGKEFGIRRYKRLPVSGAFHTRLMKPACKPLQQVLTPIRLRRPLVPVYSNVTARQMWQPGHIKRLLVEQVKNPVKWEQILQTVCARPKGEKFPQYFEVGPGHQLGALLKMTNLKAHAQYRAIDV